MYYATPYYPTYPITIYFMWPAPKSTLDVVARYSVCITPLFTTACFITSCFMWPAPKSIVDVVARYNVCITPLLFLLARSLPIL